ncbi:MAG: hypothetical protein WDM88_07865 [Galbitalea sp.]
MSRSAAILVDPASFLHLREALLQRGWHGLPSRRLRILPAARLTLAHDDEIAHLNIYAVIPGFFADPEETFDLIWERHKEVPLRGHIVRALGRINSAILASHDGLDGRASRARNNFDYFVEQFSRVLDAREREVTVRLIREMGGCAEMNRLIVALGAEPCEFTLPSVAYVQWRLRVTEVDDRLRRALAFLELGSDGRRMMAASPVGRPRSLGEAVRGLLLVPRSLAIILGARRRWAANLA